MSKLISLFVLASGLVLLNACADPPKVLQGTVVSYDAKNQILIVEDELPPKAHVTLGTAKAEFGAEPAAGDLVRIAYHEQDGKAHAGRVMNLTRQADLTSSGGH